MQFFLVCAYKSQDFAQSQKIFAQSQDRVTVTLRNSVKMKTKSFSYSAGYILLKGL